METTENQTPANASRQGDGGGTDPQKASYEAYQFGETTVGGANFAPVFAPKSPLYQANLLVPGIGGIDLGKEASASVWLLQLICHNIARAAGWWTRSDGSSITDNPLCFSNKLMLIVSEVSEAMEGDRKGIKDDKLPHRDMREVELADAVIRIFDLAGAYDMDLAGAIVEKLAYNQQRADHKPEHRAQAGGKAY